MLYHIASEFSAPDSGRALFVGCGFRFWGFREPDTTALKGTFRILKPEGRQTTQF